MAERFLINAGNLRRGGGVAVAASFINELSHQPDICCTTTLLLSDAVRENAEALGADLSGFQRVAKSEQIGLFGQWREPLLRPPHADVVFTVFGPYYGMKGRARHVVGFAQPWVIYPHNGLTARMSRSERLRTRLKYLVQTAFFARSDVLVVELEHVLRGIMRTPGLRSKNTVVVANTVDDVFFDADRWEPVTMPAREAPLRLGIVSANYPHKNLACIPLVKEILAREYGQEVEFLTTLTPEEMIANGPEFATSVTNVGPLRLAQCPSFYRELDGVFFPSLLECFSATPIEAMVMNRVLFASELPSVREVCGQLPVYFDPLDSSSIARAIATYSKGRQGGVVVDPIVERLLADGGSRARADRYLSILRAAASNL